MNARTRVTRIAALTAVILIALHAQSAFAQTSATVVFYDLTAPNRHAIQDISREAEERASGLELSFHDLSTSGLPEDSGDTVVLLSSASTEGIDPPLQPLLEERLREGEGSTTVVVALIPDRAESDVQMSRETSRAPGVDAITASTRWQENRLRALFDESVRERNRRFEAMRLEWIRTLLDRLRADD